RETLDMQFIDNRFMPGSIGMLVVSPVKAGIDHHRTRHKRCTVALIANVWFIETVGIDSLIPLHLPIDSLGIGIEQQFGWIAELPPVWRPGPMHTVAIALSGFDIRQVTMPAVAGRFWQIDTGLSTLLIKQT